jgi:hypothetical protein
MKELAKNLLLDKICDPCEYFFHTNEVDFCDFYHKVIKNNQDICENWIDRYKHENDFVGLNLKK